MFPINAKKIVSEYTGVYTSPPFSVAFSDPSIKTYRVPDGPLMGNGDFAVAVGGSFHDQTFYMSKSDMSQSMRGIGNLTYSFDTRPADSLKYRQEQDLYKAEVRSTIPFATATIKMRSWTSDESNILVTDLWTEQGVSIDVTLKLLSYTNHSISQAGAENGIIWTTREIQDSLGTPRQSFSSKICIATSVLGIKSSCSTDKNAFSTLKFTLPAHQTVRILTVIAGGYNAVNHVSSAKNIAFSLTSQKIDLQYVKHLEWWSSYWLKSYIKINDNLLERFYYGALYEMACATRKGFTAPGLGGAWFLEGSAAWGNRYTLDYNFEAPWWGVYSCNRPELAFPYYDVISKLIPAGKKLAHDSGTNGLLFSVNAHAWSGFTDLRTLNMKSNASLAALNFMMHYNYTQDENFLVNKVWPLLKELDKFWQDNLVWDQIKKRWVVNNSGAREGQKDTNAINDLAYIKAIYKFLLRESITLEGKLFQGAVIHITTSQKEKWENYLFNMSKYPTMIFDGKIIFKEAENRTRMSLGGPGDNTDVLMGVFPAEGISLGSDSVLLQIAKNTVEVLNSNPKKESWFQANSIPKIYTQAIRSGYSVQIVSDRLKQLLAGKQPYNDRGDHVQLRNNQTIVSPSHGYESVGAIEAINSMLLQSHDDTIRVFPIWIENKDAWFKDMRAFGAFLVSSEYKNGQIDFVGIKSEAGRLCRIKNPWTGNARLYIIDKKKILEKSYQLLGNVIDFSSKAGEQYLLLPPGKKKAK